MTSRADEISVSAGWDGQSANVKVKSRFFSAWDRFFGLKADKAGLGTAREVEVSQAMTKSRVTLIEAATIAVANQISENPELARKALAVFDRMNAQYDNTAATMVLVAEELKSEAAPALPTSIDGPDTLDEDLLNRWEQYAGAASSERAREKWARVLASEIRAPGTFSIKSLRVIDEIDPEVARLFERLCLSRVGRWIPDISHGLDRAELERLSDADLIREDEFPRSVPFSDGSKGDGTKWWMIRGVEYGVAISQDAPLKVDRSVLNLSDKLRFKDGVPVINVLVFTDTGDIVAKIAPNTPEVAFTNLFSGLLKYVDRPGIELLRKIEGIGFVDVETSTP